MDDDNKLPKLIQTIGDLRHAISGAPDDQRIDVWLNNEGRRLVAIGVSGENTDFSFLVEE